ncbi:hypothetical protein OM987_24155, partial [Escherichia coli]|nr:hypothetical protein [Escherichia coli]
DRNRSHWSTSKTPSYTKSVSWQHHRQSITASELRWIYRNQDNEQIMKNIKFYLRGKEVPAEKILGMPEWKDYHPKRSGLISEYSK